MDIRRLIRRYGAPLPCWSVAVTDRAVSRPITLPSQNFLIDASCGSIKPGRHSSNEFQELLGQRVQPGLGLGSQCHASLA